MAASENIVSLSKEFKILEEKISKLQKSLSSTTTAQKNLNKSQRQATATTRKHNDVVRNLRNQKEKLNDEVKKGDKTWKALGRRLSVVRSRLLIVAFGASLVSKSLGRMFMAAAEQQQAEIKLQQALGRTSQALLDHASSMQKNTRFGDEAVIAVQASIGAFIKDEDTIKSLTQATLDLASAKGMDLTAAADMVAKSVGSSTNALSRYGIAASGAAKSTERAKTVVDSITNLYGGQAKAQAESYAGTIDQMKNALGDAAEAIGDFIAPIVMGLARALTFGANLVETFTDKLTDFSNALMKYAKGQQNATTGLFDFDIALKQASESAMNMPYDDLQKQITKYSKNLEEQTKKQKESTKQVEDGTHAYRDSTQPWGTYNKNIVETTFNEEKRIATLNTLKIFQQQANEKESMAAELYAKTNTSLKSSTESMIAWIKENEKAFKSKDKFNAVLKMYEEQLDKIDKKEGDLADKKIKRYAMMTGNARDNMISVVRFNIMEAISGHIATIFKQFPTPLNFALAAGAGSIVSAMITRNLQAGAKMLGFATGGDFITAGPQAIMVGDNPGGRERVQVTPLSSPNIDGPQGSSVTVNVSGNVLSQDFVEGELAENIKEAIRRGTDFGIG